MLEILTRLILPMPATRSALSKALREVPPSACPAVAAAIVIRFVIRAFLPFARVSPPPRQRALAQRIVVHCTGRAPECKRKVAIWTPTAVADGRRRCARRADSAGGGAWRRWCVGTTASDRRRTAVTRD
jgi:hypothetical protein